MKRNDLGMKKVLLIGLASFFLIGCASIPQYQNPSEVSYQVEGKIQNMTVAEEAVQVIENNLQYASQEDMDGYVSTIISSAREETAAELATVFETYDLEHTLLSVEVLEQEDSRMLIRTQQQTVMIDSIEGTEKYRNHIAEANYTMLLEEGEWKIEETVMTDTKFIE